MARLKYFKCRGSIGVFYGLGLEEIAVNFENISGLVTLAGKNGTSKTTTLEMLSPFDCIKSRQIIEGQKYNLKNEFMLRDSYKEVCYEFNGKDYIFRIEIPSGTTMSPEGYITCDGVPLVKGKITAYRKKVVELFGSEALFYSSIFSCQGGEKLTDKTVGEFKQLLIELLGHQKYVTWWQNIGKVQTAVQAKLQKTTDDLARFDDQISDAAENNLKAVACKIELEDLNKSAEDTKDKISTLEFEIKTLGTQKTEAEKKEATVVVKKAEKEALLTEQEAATKANDDVKAEHQVWVDGKEEEILPYKTLIAQEGAIKGAHYRITQQGNIKILRGYRRCHK